MKYYEVYVPIDRFTTFTYSADADFDLGEGSVVRVPLRSRKVTGVIKREVGKYRGAKSIEEKIFDLPQNLYRLGLWVSRYYLSPPGIVFSFILPPLMKRVNKLKTYEKYRSVHKLTEAQRYAYNKIRSAAFNEEFKTFLLFGVTGSGKTEVYLRLMEDVLREGKSILYLTPEVSMIPQVLERIRGRFGMGEAYHYKLSKGKRFSYWVNALEGRLRIGVGSRMSVFSPLENLGLIVVDEEHSESYKQEDPKPRFSARDVAVMRGSLLGIPVVLGSATPSMESFYNALNGKYTLLELPERVESRDLPEVNIVDPKGKIFSVEIMEAIQETLESEEMSRVILFLNRRGYAPFAKCYGCGWEARCPNCDIALTLHKESDSLICHHCGYRITRIEKCPECNGDIFYAGWGTERIEEEVIIKFSDYNIRRMDTDSITGRHDHKEIYRGLREGEIEILLGTQMVTKGLDLPDIGLVGVVSADTAINLPDFRASERTFHLLSQVAGRAGRGGKGRVIIQSRNPDHYAIKFAREHNYRDFYEREAEFREGAGYPPFMKIARILVQSKDEEKAVRAAGVIMKKLNKFSCRERFTVLGPVVCPIRRISKRFRYHLLLKTDEEYLLQSILKELYTYSERGVRISFEIDPVNML